MENAYVSRSTKYVWYVSVIYVHSIIALYIVCGLRRYEISLVYVFSIVAQSLVGSLSFELRTCSSCHCLDLVSIQTNNGFYFAS